MVDDFAQRVENRSLTIGVVGLGYVGLPLAVAYARSGFEVEGLESDPLRADQINAGISYVEDVPSGEVADLVAAGRLRAGTDRSDLVRAGAVIICVPTPFGRSKDPDLAYVVDATEAVAETLSPGDLVILQSTTYPGTTNEVVRPILESGGLKAGVDFDLAFSPERVDPGNRDWTVANTPKVVGAVSPEGAERARLLLEVVMDEPGKVRVLSSPEAAETTKLLENTFRAVNIALVNEIALLCERMGVDIWEVIAGASTKPFGYMAFTPGPGVGGHCIAVDPYYLAWRARTYDFQAKFIELAAEANQRMPRHVMHRVARLLNSVSKPVRGSKVLALGASFKPGVGDTRNSAAIAVMELLRAEGALVDYADPHVPSISLAGEELRPVDLTAEKIEAADVVVILVAHSEFDYELVASRARLVFDAVNGLGDRPTTGERERL